MTGQIKLYAAERKFSRFFRIMRHRPVNTFSEVNIMQLSQKETDLLKDMKDQEMLCVEKYTKHSQSAIDPQLKNLFSQFAQTEREHYDMLVQMEQGAVPSPAVASGATPSFSATYQAEETPDKQNDCYLCTDLLTTEKHASHLYDTCIFEFADENARNLLNSIQKQEQGHGKAIYDYMSVNGMYS